MVDYRVAAMNILQFLAVRRKGRWTRLNAKDKRNAPMLRQAVLRLVRTGMVELGGGNYMRATIAGIKRANRG